MEALLAEAEERAKRVEKENEERARAQLKEAEATFKAELAAAEEASEKEAILRAEIESENAENLRKLRQKCEEAAAAAVAAGTHYPRDGDPPEGSQGQAQAPKEQPKTGGPPGDGGKGPP